MLTNHYNLIAKYGIHQKKTINLLKASQNFNNFTTFLLKMWQLFGNFQKTSIDHVVWDFFFSKMVNCCHNKKTLL